MRRALIRTAALGIAMIAGVTTSPAAERVYEPTTPADGNRAAVAAPHDDWYATVQSKFDRFSGKHADVVFDGDSITNRWETTGKETWNAHYAKVAADFGIEGDRVENVLWRLNKGQVDGIDPKVVVLMIGTNNCGRDTAAQIADGIKVLVREYLARCPHAHLVLMHVFPRGATPNDGGRQKVTAINAALAPLARNERVSLVDITKRLEEPDGTIAPSMMPDSVHPTAEGYRIWADAIQPLLDRYLAK